MMYMASWPSGKARVCKTLITGSNPVDASQKERVHQRLAFLLSLSENVKAHFHVGALPRLAFLSLEPALEPAN